MLPFMASSQTTIPNGDFESWEQSSNYADPSSWDSPNSTSATLGVVTVSEESTIVQNGSSAVKLESGSIIGTPIPGLITLGEFNINILTFEATIEGGTPFTGRPESLSGYYQYEPAFGDEAFIGIILLKQNGGNWDTIGDGNFSSTTELLVWTPFTATVTYRSTETPTHMNIIILSSDRNAPQPTSTLYVDNMSLTYPASIQSMTTEAVHFYVSSDFLYLNPHLQSESSLIEIYSIDGKLILSSVYHPMQGENAKIDIQMLNQGMYIAVLSNESGSFVQKFVK